MSLLPTKPMTPQTDPSGYTIMVYGPPGIGKSTFGVQAPGSIVIATEPGLKSLVRSEVLVNTWEELCAVAGEIAAGNHPFKTVVVDTVDNAVKMASEFIARKFKVDHPSDLKWGKAAILNNEILRVFSRLAALPYGLILISHQKNVTIESPTGKYSRTEPNLSAGIQNVIVGMVDILMQMNLLQGDDGNLYRVLKTKPSKFYVAKDRTPAELPAIIGLPDKNRAYADFEEIFVKCLQGEHTQQAENLTENVAELNQVVADSETDHEPAAVSAE